MPGDEVDRQRYDMLKEREREGGLAAAESAELSRLARALGEAENGALDSATEEMRRGNMGLQAELAALRSQKAELEALLLRKERFVRRARSLARRIEAERRDLVDAYRRITGAGLGSRGVGPVPPP